jgi:hypothetical protein
MANDLASLRGILKDPAQIKANAWALIQALTGLVNAGAGCVGEDRQTQELVLRALEHRDAFGDLIAIVDAIAHKQGLYPYLEPDMLSIAALLAYEAHRPPNLNEVVFHRAQTEIYDLLSQGENVVLSAPTSFGKSLLIDALIASGRYKNVVVIVPTIALIDETRRRLSGRFGHQFKIVTHIAQAASEANIFVFTQERVLEYASLPKLELFIIDEFYKLDPRSDPDRAFLLNQAFYRLHRTGAQFYLLGPNIRQLPLDLPTKLKFRFVATDYATVVSETIRVKPPKEERLEELVRLAKGLKEPTLIYCASPASARRIATALVGASIDDSHADLSDASNWIADQYHPDWIFGRALRHGIGVHHGRIPRSLAQFTVRAFNAEKLRYLICTSTLIEGVNTKAKNIIIYDNRIAKQRFDFFTFNNIRGRSGRMLEHFVGRVYLFNDPPTEDLPPIDVPAFTQTEQTPQSVLIQIEDEDLTERSKQRLQPLYLQAHLDLRIIKANRGVAPEAQINLAKHLESHPEKYSNALGWNGLPSYEQLLEVSQLIWDYLIPGAGMHGGVISASQLAFRLNRYRTTPSVHTLIVKELSGQSELDLDADRAVEDVLEFIRYWPTFHFPRLLMALDRIQRNVFERLGVKHGDFSVFAAQLENQFLPGGIVALEEYGLPIQIAIKLSPYLKDPESLDETLKSLRQLNVELLQNLTPFERSILDDTIRNL